MPKKSSSEPKNKLVFALLHVFFNSFGIDRFYLGDTKRGAMKLLLIILTIVTFFLGMVSFLTLPDGIPGMFGSLGPHASESPEPDLHSTQRSWVYAFILFAGITLVWGIIDTMVFLYNAFTRSKAAPWGFGNAKFKPDTTTGALIVAVLHLLFGGPVLTVTVKSGRGPENNSVESKPGPFKQYLNFVKQTMAI